MKQKLAQVARLILTVVLLVTCGAACSGGKKSKELLALDKAYDAGVLTKDEYAAKKAALASQAAKRAALDKAFETGILTKDEYLTKKAALLTPENIARENIAPENVTQKNVAAGPAPAAAPAPHATPTESAPGHSYRMKMVKVMDAQGFERPIMSFSMLVPTDWQSQGATTWNVKDSCNTVQTNIRTSGPDGREFDVFPAYNWTWADDPKFLQQTFAQKAQMGIHACDVIPTLGASDYLRRNLAKLRPNAQVVSVEPAAKLMQILQQQARQTEQSAAQYRLQQRVRPDAARARLKYNVNGQPVEEWLTVVTVITGTLSPTYNAVTNRQTQAYFYSCEARAFAERAPQGQLESSERLFDLINSTFRVNPEWQARVNNNALAIQQIELKGVRDRSAIVAKNADDIRNIRRQGFENQQKGQDRAAAQFSQSTRDVETYRDPTSGTTVELSNQYGHAWVNNKGEYLLSDQAGFDPSVAFKEDWKPLEHVKP